MKKRAIFTLTIIGILIVVGSLLIPMPKNETVRWIPEPGCSKPLAPGCVGASGPNGESLIPIGSEYITDNKLRYSGITIGVLVLVAAQIYNYKVSTNLSNKNK